MPRFGLKNNKLTIKDHFVKNDKNMQYKKSVQIFSKSFYFSFSLLNLYTFPSR